MKIISLAKVGSAPVGMEGACAAFKQLPIGRADGSPHFSFRVFTLKPGGHTPYHAHPFEHLNYFIEGQGVLVSPSGDEKPVEPGDFALVLPGEKHQYKNTSADRDLVMICAVPAEYE
jgi:quercetin dioxygenase-like cupin family protein